MGCGLEEGEVGVGGCEHGAPCSVGLSVIFVDCHLSLPLWSTIRAFGASCSPTCRQLSGRVWPHGLSPHWKALGSSRLVWKPQSLPARSPSCLGLCRSAGDSLCLLPHRLGSGCRQPQEVRAERRLLSEELSQLGQKGLEVPGPG